MDSLFGGSKSTSEPVDMTPKPFKNLQQPFADILKQLLGTGTGGGMTGIPQYGAAEAQAAGQNLAAPMTANEQTSLDQLQQQSVNPNAQNYINDLLAGKYLPGGEMANPFLNASIEAAQRPTLENLEETLSRVLPGRFTQAGQMTQPQGSSAFDRAAAIATRGATQAMADIATQLSFGTQEAERGRQQEAITLNSQQLDSQIKNLQAQGLPRLIQQLGIDNGLQEFQTRIQALLAALGVTQAATSPTVATKGESETKGGIIPGITGLIGSVYNPAPR